jgi:hypothetical protein
MDVKLSGWFSSLSGLGSQKMDEIGMLHFIFIMCISLISSLLISFLYTRLCKGRRPGV